MQREVIQTQDGSKSLHLPEWNESYHSSHGALQEAIHVFIKNGLSKITLPEITIIEYGFGTGLNTWLSCLEAYKLKKQIKYIGLEKYPLPFNEVNALDYPSLLENIDDAFGRIHRIPWNSFYPIIENFQLKKIQIDFREYTYQEKVDLVYFDAFGYRVQPHLWTEEIFTNIYQNLNNNGLLTTYSSKGEIRRILQKIGFTVEKLEGPKGKREMINAWKK